MFKTFWQKRYRKKSSFTIVIKVTFSTLKHFCLCVYLYSVHKPSGFFPIVEILFISKKKWHQWRWSSLYSAYVDVMNRDIFPVSLQIFINYTSLQFTLKCIFSHRGFLCLSWYLSNWEALKNGNMLTEQARRIQIILFLPLCRNNVNIYRSGKLSGVFNKWEPNHSLCADAISCFDLNISQLGAVAPRRVNQISHLHLG